MSKLVIVLLLCSTFGLSGCSTREVAAGAIGAGAGYVIGRETD